MVSLRSADTCSLLLQPGHVYMVSVRDFSDGPIQDQTTKKQDKKNAVFPAISLQRGQRPAQQDLPTVPLSNRRHLGVNL